MSTKIPEFHLPMSSGIGVLYARNTERIPPRTGGTNRVVDIEIHHEIATQAECASLDDILPGFWEAASRALGNAGSGGRTYVWDAKSGEWHGDANVEISHIGGGMIYSGPAQIRTVKAKGIKRGMVCVVSIRLLSVDPLGSRGAISASLAEPVEYTFERVTQASLPATVQAGQTSLFGGSPAGSGPVYLDVQALNLVSYMDDSGGGDGIVMMVSADSVLISDTVDYENGSHTEIPRSQIMAVYPLCGPSGGDVRPRLEQLAEQGMLKGANVTIEHLMSALVEAIDNGLESLDDGWPLGASLRDEAVRMAMSEMQDLPPEPDGEDAVIIDDEVDN